MASIVVAAACDSRPPVTRDQTTPAVQASAQARPIFGADGVAQLSETSFKPETTFVVRDSGTWAALWRRLDNTIAAPAVDFSSEMVLGASLGMGVWGRDISIRVTPDRRDSLVVIVHKRLNAPNVCVLDGIRSPAALLRVARDTRPIAFHWEVEELRCNSS